MKVNIALVFALLAPLAACEITMRNTENARDDAIEIRGEKGEEVARSGKPDCAGWTAVTAAVKLDGQPADSVNVAAFCGDTKVAECQAITGIGRRDASCSYTQPLHHEGRLACLVSGISGWPNFAASCTVN